MAQVEILSRANIRIDKFLDNCSAEELLKIKTLLPTYLEKANKIPDRDPDRVTEGCMVL